MVALSFGNPRVAMAKVGREPRQFAAQSKTSIGEIDNLIGELQTLRKKLQTDGDLIQRDIAQHAELSQQVMQLTTIISDSVKKLPRGPGISR